MLWLNYVFTSLIPIILFTFSRTRPTLMSKRWTRNKKKLVEISLILLFLYLLPRGTWLSSAVHARAHGPFFFSQTSLPGLLAASLQPISNDIRCSGAKFSAVYGVLRFNPGTGFLITGFWVPPVRTHDHISRYLVFCTLYTKQDFTAIPEIGQLHTRLGSKSCQFGLHLFFLSPGPEYIGFAVGSGD